MRMVTVLVPSRLAVAFHTCFRSVLRTFRQTVPVESVTRTRR